MISESAHPDPIQKWVSFCSAVKGWKTELWTKHIHRSRATETSYFSCLEEKEWDNSLGCPYLNTSLNRNQQTGLKVAFSLLWWLWDFIVIVGNCYCPECHNQETLLLTQNVILFLQGAEMISRVPKVLPNAKYLPVFFFLLVKEWHRLQQVLQLTD